MYGYNFFFPGNALGADTYCLGALHLYTPLPFKPGEGGFGELFRSHLFVNVGNCGNMQDFNLREYRFSFLKSSLFNRSKIL